MQRSEHLTHHKGEVCFPGGKLDKSDEDEVEASLREAEEEIGLHHDQIDVIAVLPPLVGRSGFLVSPTVAFIPDDFTPQPNPDEVDSTFSLPLRRFLTSHNMTHFSYSERGKLYYIPMFQDTITETGELYTTWGLTASFCVIFAVIVFQKATDFEMAPGLKLGPADPLWINSRHLKGRTKDSKL